MNKGNCIRWTLPQGSGKANKELERITNSETLVTDRHFVMAISRQEIERGDFSRLHHEFSLEQPAKKLRSMLGRTTFAIMDYDHHGEELYEIPEVRAFLREAHTQYPCWLAFASVQTGTLRTIAACVADPITALKRVGGSPVKLTMPREQAVAFYISAFPLAGAVYQAAGCRHSQSRKLLEQSAKHLGIL